MTVRARRATAGFATLALAALPIIGFAASASATSTIIDTITTDENQFEDQYGSALSHDGTLIALPGYSASTVTLVDTTDNSQVLVTDTNSDIDYPMGVAFSADDSTVYVANTDSDVVTVIDVATATVTDTFDVNESSNTAIAVSPDGNTLLIADDYDSISAYDITSNSYTELWSVAYGLDYTMGIYFSADSSTALMVDYYGSTQTVTLSDHSLGSVVTTDAEAGSYGNCTNADHTVFAISDYSTVMYLIEVATGDVLESIDLTDNDANALMNCVFTSGGQLLVSDWGYNNDGDGGHVFVLDASTLELIETIETPDVEYTNALVLLDNCTLYAASEYTNISVIGLDGTYCGTAPAPTPTPTEAALASTGVNGDSAIASAIAAATLLLVGAVAVAAVRRRTV